MIQHIFCMIFNNNKEQISQVLYDYWNTQQLFSLLLFGETFNDLLSALHAHLVFEIRDLVWTTFHKNTSLPEGAQDAVDPPRIGVLPRLVDWSESKSDSDVVEYTLLQHLDVLSLVRDVLSLVRDVLSLFRDSGGEGLLGLG